MWNTKNLIGERITVQTKKEDLTFEGIFLEFFESSGSIVLKNWKEKLKKKIIDKGEIVIIKKDGWITIKKHFEVSE